MYNVKITTYENSIEVSLYNTIIDDSTSTPPSLLARPRRACPGCRLLPPSEVVENPFESGTYIYQEFLDEDELKLRKDKNLKDAQHRASNAVRSLALSNHWDSFLTLTFDDSKSPKAGVDYNSALYSAKRALRELRSLYPGMSYILVPEQGEKNGRWHFHALVAGLPKSAYKFSGHFTRSHEKIYNLPAWRFGFTTATFVRDQNKVCRYIAKYITKSSSCVPFNCKRYLCSQGLKNCEKEADKFLLEYEIMVGLKDISLSVAEYMTFYHVPDFSLSHVSGECLKLYLPRDGLNNDIFSLLRDLDLRGSCFS